MSTPLLFTLALLVYLCPLVSIAQTEFPYGSAQDSLLPEWTRLMYQPSPDPGQVIEAYDAYYASHAFVKNGHTQYYKRWLRSLARELPQLKGSRMHRSQGRSVIAQWECIGPWDWDHTAADRSYAPGAAHIYTVEQARSNPDILYAGTATAGVWKSADRGLSWTPLSEHMRTGAVTALEINHLQPQTVYAELLNSIYKSTNGGNNWSKTGDFVFQALALEVNDVVMHPTDTAKIFAATDLALYRSANGGSTWTLILPGDFLEIEFHPTQPDTLYAVKYVSDKTEFYRSTDGGNTFFLQISGWPIPNIPLGEHQRRTEIAVSPDAPDKVFALATGSANGGSGLYGVYVSEDAGQTWTFTCCGEGPGGPPSLENPNLMGWNDDGTDDGGQYYYDLAFAVSPTNADSIYVGGINLWVSADGGATFVCPAKWSHPQKPNYVHADIHDIQFYPGTHEIWLACDGGIFRSTNNGAAFTRKMNGISGTDFWGFGTGFWDGEVMLGGTYHNGTLLKDNNVYLNDWISTDGGDNFRGFVNPGKPKQVYSDYNIKSLSGNRNVKNGTRTFMKKPNASYIIGQSSEMVFHPQYFGTWYSGSGRDLWKTVDDGYTFTLMHSFPGDVAAMDIAWSNPNVLYVCTWPGWWSTKRIYRSEDGGDSFVDITPSTDQLTNNTWVPYDIAVDAVNPMKIWIVRTSMYGDTDLDGVAVFTSDNGGETWQNMTTDALDDEAFTAIMHQAGTQGGIYLGTRESVYYRNASMTDWVWYGDGLPAATFATRMLPYYREDKMRIATNRSVWESPLYESSSPLAQPSTKIKRHDCLQDTVFFVDHSIINETSAAWFWQFPGGTPATSTVRDPKVLYSAPGMYSVTLVVSDFNGSDTITIADMIEVRNLCDLDPTPGRAMKCTDYPDYAIVPNIGYSGNTFTISAWVRPAAIQSDYAGIVLSDGVVCGLNFREGNNTLGYHWGGSTQAWQWDSNLEVPVDKWSHVAMVVSATQVQLYVNGQQATHSISHAPATINTMKIGSYQGWQSRNFNGLIDEVCIWNRSLTTGEIRALRHLTKNPENDAGLRLYYQFNEETSTIYDKAHAYDAILNGDATREKSRAPVGAGISQSMNIISPNQYYFDDVGLMLSFPVGGITPHGIVYVSRLDVGPDSMMTNCVPMSHGYWIVNNYGSNLEITCPDTVKLDGLAFISGAMQDNIENDFYFRGANAEVNGWKIGSGDSGITECGVQGRATFSEIDSEFTTLGQIMAIRDSMQYGRPQIAVVHDADTSIYQRGGSSMALVVQSEYKGLLLPRYTSTVLQNVSSPAEGSIAYVTDLKQVACFDGTQWRFLEAEYLEPPVYSGLSEFAGVSLGGGGTASALLSLGIQKGVLVLPEFTADSIVNINFPGQGLLVYRSDLHRLSYYDGVDWISPAYSDDALTASTGEAVQNLPGLRIGQGTKDPNALLHIIDAQRALGLPQALTRDVQGPHAGLIVFDPSLKALCFFDGVGWKLVK